MNQGLRFAITLVCLTLVACAGSDSPGNSINNSADIFAADLSVAVDVPEADTGPAEDTAAPVDTSVLADSSGPATDIASPEDTNQPADVAVTDSEIAQDTVAEDTTTTSPADVVDGQGPGKTDASTPPADAIATPDTGTGSPLCCDKGQQCAPGSVCGDGPFNARKCKSLNLLKPGACWTDDQCGAGASCQGVMLCGCAATCKAMDKPGMCVKNPTGGAKCKLDGKGLMKGCVAGEFCKLPETNLTCAGEGTCAVLQKICTKEYKPVCGCDKQTYGNACLANAQGKNFSSKVACSGGPTPIPVCCKNDNECKAGGVCILDASGKGQCKSTLILNKGQCWNKSQCGGAACKGAVVCACGAKCKSPDKPGTCDTPTPGVCKVGDNTTCSKGFYCNGPCGQSGKCAPIPQMCTMEFKPVCGCNKKTYGNACSAAAAGVSVASQGDCQGGGTPTCVVGKVGACGKSEFCAGTCGKTGKCTPMPKGCPKINKPVCGCDGKTYSNSCVANLAGQETKTTGACGANAGGCCTAASGCKNKTDSCIKDAKGTGVCKDTSKLGAGECWNDGDCKGSVCQGAVLCPCGANCIVPDKPGKCAAPGFCIVGSGKGCPDTDFCDGPCGLSGACVPKPKMCTKIYKPVCGCDNQTYGNSCEANAKGMGVKAQGKCAAGGGGGPNCCKDDKSCSGGVCANIIGGSGICKSTKTLKAGQCWTDAQCKGKTCAAAVVCPCGSNCLMPDAPGKCI